MSKPRKPTATPWSGSSIASIERGFFRLDGRLAADVLSVDAPADHLVGPLAVHLEVVGACNLTCTHCFAGALPRNQHPLSTAEMDGLFADLAGIGSFRLGLTGGEPLLRKDLFDILDAAVGRGLCPCLTTNALLLTEESAREFGKRQLVWLNVSLEGPTAESNDAVRGSGTFAGVIEKLKLLRRHARFTLAFTVLSTNAHLVRQCAELAYQVGAHTAVFRPLYPAGVALDHLDLMPSFAQYSGALRELADVRLPEGDLRGLDPFSPATRAATQPRIHTSHTCGAGQHVCSVSVQGDVNPCSFLGPAFNSGNIRQAPFRHLAHRPAVPPHARPVGRISGRLSRPKPGFRRLDRRSRPVARRAPSARRRCVLAPRRECRGRPFRPSTDVRAAPRLLALTGRFAMLPEPYQWIVAQFEPEGDPWLLLNVARELEEAGNLPGAATVYDRAFGIAPEIAVVQERRTAVLDRLAVVEHGLRFRYVPAGPFLMGSQDGEPDERPLHPVWLSAFWLSETPISWADYCRLMGWSAPPEGFPGDWQAPAEGFDAAPFHLREANKIRLQYCEDRTQRARGWHSHAPGQEWRQGETVQTAQQLFGAPQRDEPDAPWQYDRKPMVAVGWQEAQELGDRLSTAAVRYGLPTEAQWEKAARGGLIGARHAWGNEKPSRACCDFDRYEAFSILPMTTFPANGYGLYAVNGCVWEWTGDWYDRDFYRDSPDNDPEGPAEGEEKVLRGGSWADCGEVATVTFRMSRGSRSWREGEWGRHLTPNVGFRLARTVLGTADL